MQEKSIKVLFLALFLVSMSVLFVIAENESLQDINDYQNNGAENKDNSDLSLENVDYNQIQTDKPSAEKCFEIEDRRARLKCKLQNREEIKSMIAEKYSEFANSSSIYETCNGLKNQGLCVAFMTRSMKCYDLDGEKKDRCFKVTAEFKETKISKELLSNGDVTKARERISNYMVLVLENIEKKVEKASKEEKITDDNASILLEKITRIKRLLFEGNNKKSLIRSEIIELKAFWYRSINNG